MFYAVYRLSDGKFLRVWPQKPDYDPATEGMAEFEEHERPHTVNERYDANSPTKKRLSTQQELDDVDALKRLTAAEQTVPRDPVLLAVAELVMRELNVVRAALMPLVPDAVKTDLVPLTRQQVVNSLKPMYQRALKHAKDAGR